MKKVLFVATITNHIISFHTAYLKWFKEQGYEVHVASRGEEPIEYCDKHYNLSFERFPIKKNNLRVYKQLKNIINDNEYELIHCHTPVGGVLTRLAARKLRKTGTKVIYTAHGFHFYKGAPFINWLIYYPIEKICARWTDCLITITKEDYILAKKKIKAKKIEHISGIGMDTERFQKELSEEEKKKKKRELKIDENDVIFAYVAELNKNKNQIILINTIKDLKKEISNVKLLLIGDGPLLQNYKNIIKENNLENNIELLGKRNDINEILSIIDIYLASSLREGLPVNVMEAMYRSLPIIATDNRGHRELVYNEKNGYIVNKQEEFVKKIIILIRNKELRNKFGDESKQMSSQYVINKVKNQMEKIYMKLIGERNESDFFL